eukprot:jgi/Astpho2/7696/e_gw1.00115.7.1_t
MVKAYLRYELASAFGVVASGANILYDDTGKIIFAACLENVAMWSVKQASVVRLLQTPPSASGKPAAEATQLALSTPGQPLRQLGVGHADGTVRLWQLAADPSCTATLSGHKSAITALSFNKDSSLLASASRDTNITIWDVAAEAGLFKLRGHQDEVTDLAFVHSTNKLLSSSKDSHMRVWDLDTQHCSQTVVGCQGEVWSLAVSPDEQRLMTASADAELRMYRLDAQAAGQTGASYAQPMGESQRKTVWNPVPCCAGAVRRSSTDRPVRLRFDQSGTVVVCQSAGKVLEVFRARTAAEAQKHLKRRRKRKREKAGLDGVDPSSKAEDELAASDELVAMQASTRNFHKQLSDEEAVLQELRTKAKLRGVAISPTSTGSKLQLSVALANNSLETWDLDGTNAHRPFAVEGPGHRSDVRCIALSPDDSLLLSASSNSVKIWHPLTAACLHTIDSGYGLAALFAPGQKHAVLGTKEGNLELFDIGASSLLASIRAHEGAVWSLASLPDSSGFVSGSADHSVKFWEWAIAVDEASSRRQLTISHTRTLEMTDDVLGIRVTPNGKLIAVALLDSTVKVFFTDSLKFFLSLYGHKLPVLSMDISSDSTLLVTGSADKNIKIWGLDFGDCHKSLFAHADSVMQVAFVPNTHYVFSVGKDRVVKYWDADKFELLLTLEGHHAEVWCLAVSSLGDFVVTGSHDRSLRRWVRTDEPFFVEEEREKRLDSLFEADVEDSARAERRQKVPEQGAVGPAGRRTEETVGAVDSIVEALELAAAEGTRQQEHAALGAAAKPLPANPLLRGQAPDAHVMQTLAGVKAAHLEQALLLLPFQGAQKLLEYLCIPLERGAQVELCCRVCTLLMRLHHQQLMATPQARPLMIKLQKRLREGIQDVKDVMGFNLAALQHLRRAAQEQSSSMTGGSTVKKYRLPAAA